VRVVCATYRRAHLLPRLVAALEAQTFPMDRVEVCIVDNASHDDTGAVLAELARTSTLHLVVLAEAENDGPARARNRGWRTTDIDLLAYIDDDCVPDPDWLERGVAAMRADEGLGVVQGAVRVPEGITMTPWSVIRELDGPSPYFEGCNVFYRRAALAAAGGFSELLGWYGEDTEAGWSVVDLGWRRAFEGAAGVVHDHEERGLRWHLRNGYLERNLIGVGRRHPAFAREAYWRRWAWKKETAALTVGGLLAAVGVGLQVWPSLLALLPWVWLRWPRRGHRTYPWLGFQRLAVDAAQAAGHLAGSIRYRTLVL
jgi:glycosyltransferase involved in cell wall biosynthesis